MCQNGLAAKQDGGDFFDNIHSALLLCGLGTEYYLDAEGNFKPLKELKQK